MERHASTPKQLALFSTSFSTSNRGAKQARAKSQAPQSTQLSLFEYKPPKRKRDKAKATMDRLTWNNQALECYRINAECHKCSLAMLGFSRHSTIKDRACKVYRYIRQAIEQIGFPREVTHGGYSHVFKHKKEITFAYYDNDDEPIYQAMQTGASLYKVDHSRPFLQTEKLEVNLGYLKGVPVDSHPLYRKQGSSTYLG